MDRGKKRSRSNWMEFTNLRADCNCCRRSCSKRCNCDSGGFNPDAGVALHDRVETIDRIGHVGDDAPGTVGLD